MGTLARGKSDARTGRPRSILDLADGRTEGWGKGSDVMV